MLTHGPYSVNRDTGSQWEPRQGAETHTCSSRYHRTLSGQAEAEAGPQLCLLPELSDVPVRRGWQAAGVPRLLEGGRAVGPGSIERAVGC